ncbi:unnamed protein product [Lactuca virosa]|uniref:Uncharacterized protein n=1 Tax=Lactuca virosa TaxID=75947 RepID=A0AAU9MKS9_9ASTR|nr:unnamed protein product [Lactuca virosa]
MFRLFQKSIFREADEMELKFNNKINNEDLDLFTVFLNQEIRRLSQKVCYDFNTVQDVMQSTKRAWLQDKSTIVLDRHLLAKDIVYVFSCYYCGFRNILAYWSNCMYLT